MTASAGRLSIMIPARNEEAGIDRTLDALLGAAESLVDHEQIKEIEVVVVDDGSSDRTAIVVGSRARDDSRLRLVQHTTRRGLGGAITTGFAHTTGDVVLYTDADLPFDPAEMGRALHLMGTRDADLVSAYRHSRAGEGGQRWVYSYAYNLLTRSLLRLRVRDVNFAAKLIRREVLDAIELRSEGSFVDAELLAKADALGFRIVQFGVDYFPRTRGSSTLSSPSVIATILREMRAIRPEIESLRRNGATARR